LKYRKIASNCSYKDFEKLPKFGASQYFTKSSFTKTMCLTERFLPQLFGKPRTWAQW